VRGASLSSTVVLIMDSELAEDEPQPRTHDRGMIFEH
jgi:hypothetical protein